MKYTITINQKAVIDNWLDLDLVDCAVYDYLHSRVLAKKKVIKIIDDREYFRIQYEHFINEMPLLWIKNKQSLSRRIDKLISQNILEKKMINWNSPYFRFWDNAELLQYSKVSCDVLESQGAVDLKVKGGLTDESRGAGLESPGINNNIINNNTNNNNITNNDVAEATEQVQEPENELFKKLWLQRTWTWITDTEEKEKSCAKKEKEVWEIIEEKQYWNEDVNNVIDMMKKFLEWMWMIYKPEVKKTEWKNITDRMAISTMIRSNAFKGACKMFNLKPEEYLLKIMEYWVTDPFYASQLHNWRGLQKNRQSIHNKFMWEEFKKAKKNVFKNQAR